MKKNKLKYFIWGIMLIFLSFSSFIAGFFIGDNLNQNKIKKNLTKKDNTIFNLEKKIDSLSNELNKTTQQTKKTTDILDINEIMTTTNIPSEIEDYESVNKKIKNKEIKDLTNIQKIKQKKLKQKPKLVIILDDVSFNYQVKAIKSIPFKITPSFFPPTKIHPNTPIYAKEFKDYMVHIPMQALHFPRPEPNTININWSYEKIKKRIDEIKSIFPNAKFINNHTGSKFTANLKEMKYLFKALKEDNLGFVDSRTTPYTKAKIVEKIYHIPFFERNIFLDNRMSVKSIQNQLKKAVLIAKQKGYAIAIGHPHSATIKALKTAQKILKDVDVITINELYNLQYNGN